MGREVSGSAVVRTLAVPVLALCLAMTLVPTPPAPAQDQPSNTNWNAEDTAGVVAHWLAAAERGDPRSMLALGRSYRTGLGVRQDAALAYKWLSLAARFAAPGAAEERDALALNMTLEERARGEMLARDWQPKADTRSASGDPVAVPQDATEVSAPPLEAIREAQVLLADLGYAPGPADGVWGTQSSLAYDEFLRDSGLPPSGALTPAGLLAMRSVAGRRGSEEQDRVLPDQAGIADVPPPEAIREAQELLEQLGYSPGPADGVWGIRSHLAYEQFLQDAGLPPADALTPNAFLALRSIVEQRRPNLPGAGQDGAGTTQGPLPIEAVQEAQALLAQLGYAPGPLDGIWGRQSALAYEEFRRDSGLPPEDALTVGGILALRSHALWPVEEARESGIPDRVAIGDEVLIEKPPTGLPSVDLSASEVIREVQSRLAGLGYAPGPADGAWTTSTAAAYEQFLSDAGLPVSDVLSEEGFRALRSPALPSDVEVEVPGAPESASGASVALPEDVPVESVAVKSPTLEEIREAQEILVQLGYAPDPADGVWSARMEAAYGQFLRDIGLPTGEALIPEALPVLRWATDHPAGEVAGVDPPAGVDAASREARREAQVLLAQLGYAPGVADGVWGRRSVEDYRRFLLDAGLPPADALAPEGLLALRAIAGQLGQVVVARPDPRPAGIGDTVSSAAVREAQLHLEQLGYAPGPADGVWGSATESQYRRFLQDAGIPSADALSLEGLRSLRIRAAMTALPDGFASERRDGARPSGLLHRLVDGGDVEVFESALVLGADPDLPDRRGWTPLMRAVTLDRPLFIHRLIAAGADLNAQAEDGARALTLAVSHGNQAAIALLVDAGADVLLQGPDGRTALDLLRERYGNASAARASGMNATVVALLDDRGNEAAPRISEESGRMSDERSPGTEFRDCPGCPEMVVLPAEGVRSGNPNDEADRREEDGQFHRVGIARPFAVGKYEVKREEFGLFAEEAGQAAGSACRTYEEGRWRDREGRGWENPGFSQGNLHPVVCVTWQEAKAYTEWLTERTGNTYRLLSESEWEFAERGTTEPDDPGSRASSRLVDRESAGSPRVGRGTVRQRKTAPVGNLAGNPFGLHDMRANAREWVEDCWHDRNDIRPVEGNSREPTVTCQRRVVRGGGWDSGARHLRSVARAWRFEWSRSATVGFRVAREIRE